MASTNKTTNYNLPQWIGSDKPTWLGDLNNAFLTIDTTMKNNSDTATLANGNADTALDNSQNALNKIGNLNNLLTTNKNDLVQAINDAVTTAFENNFKNKFTFSSTNIPSSAISIECDKGTAQIKGAAVNLMVNGDGTLFKIPANIYIGLTNMTDKNFTVTLYLADQYFTSLKQDFLKEERNFAFMVESVNKNGDLNAFTLNYNPSAQANKKWSISANFNNNELLTTLDFTLAIANVLISLYPLS